ncbi:DUF4139 domain-containing protein [Chloroflexota bacterium]
MSKRRWLAWGIVAAVVLAGVSALGGGMGPLPADAQSGGIELAVYNQNMALVKDRRSLELSRGLNDVRFSDVAALIDPTSVHFLSLTDPEGTVVLEQNYEYDVVGSAKLLSKYVDQVITVQTDDGQEYTGTLLSGANDVILQTEDGQVVVIRLERIKQFNFPELPEGLITRPTLVWQIETPGDGSQDVEVTYITNGINWAANYTLVLAEDDASLDLNGWVTLDNRSGATYRDAKLKLIAGDLHRVPTVDYVVEKEDRVYAAAEAGPAVEEREFFEYHLYEVQRPVTVKEQQTKQIQFVTASDVPSDKFFVYDGSQMRLGGYYRPVDDPSYGTASSKKVMVMIEFSNNEDAGLGIPLPKGTVRVYQKDVDGSTLLVGEDAIDHTPKDEEVRLYVGDAFDIVGERVQTDFRVDYDDEWLEESYEIRVRNHKGEDVEVRVVEHMFRWSEWTLIDQSHEHTKMDSKTIEFRVPVEADGETVVTYTVLYEW